MDLARAGDCLERLFMPVHVRRTMIEDNKSASKVRIFLCLFKKREFYLHISNIFCTFALAKVLIDQIGSINLSETY